MKENENKKQEKKENENAESIVASELVQTDAKTL